MLHGLPTQTEYLTAQQLAERMQCSVKTIERMKREGLPHVVWGRRLVRFNAAEVDRWIEKERAA